MNRYRTVATPGPGLCFYAGNSRATEDMSRNTGIRRGRYSHRSWFVELWLRGRYVGVCR